MKTKEILEVRFVWNGVIQTELFVIEYEGFFDRDKSLVQIAWASAFYNAPVLEVKLLHAGPSDVIDKILKEQVSKKGE